MQVKAGQNFAIPARASLQNRGRELFFLAADNESLGIETPVGDSTAGFNVDLLPARLNRRFDVSRYLPPDDRAHEPHQPFGFSQVALPDRLHNDEEAIVHTVVEILRA